MKKSVLLMGLALALFSCNSGNKESSSDEITEDISSATSGENYNCLKEFQEDYDKLLTKEDIASVYSIDFDAAKVQLSPGNYGEHMYQWPSDRPDMEHEMGGMKLKTPDHNSMGISKLSFFSDDRDLQSNKENFDMGYKELSEKELKAIDDNMEKQSEEIQKTGKEMMKVRAKSSWDFVDGTGSSAWYKWDERYGGELAVLAGQAKFYIQVKVSEDPQENKGIAMKLAEKVLEKCHL